MVELYQCNIVKYDSLKNLPFENHLVADYSFETHLKHYEL